MPRFCVARMNLFDNTLTQEIVEAESDVEAILSLEDWMREDLVLPTTQETLKRLAFDADSMVSAIEIT